MRASGSLHQYLIFKTRCSTRNLYGLFYCDLGCVSLSFPAMSWTFLMDFHLSQCLLVFPYVSISLISPFTLAHIKIIPSSNDPNNPLFSKDSKCYSWFWDNQASRTNRKKKIRANLTAFYSYARGQSSQVFLCLPSFIQMLILKRILNALFLSNFYQFGMCIWNGPTVQKVKKGKVEI